jgi:hypothetical protein
LVPWFITIKAFTKNKRCRINSHDWCWMSSNLFPKLWTPCELCLSQCTIDVAVQNS